MMWEEKKPKHRDAAAGLTTASMKAALITCEGKAMACPFRGAFLPLI